MKCSENIKEVGLIKKKKGFTLIEILIVLAIISILSGAVLASISGQREKAQVNKALAEMSARLQPMMMCWSDGGVVRTFAGDICNLGASYGQWPAPPTGFVTDLANIVNNSNWFVFVRNSTTGKIVVCCNGAMSQCGLVEDVCNATSTF